MLFAGICAVVFYICASNHAINVLQWLWLLCRWLTLQNWWNLFLSCWAVVNTIGNDFGMVLVKVFMFFAEASRKLSGSKLFKRRHWKTPSPFVWKIGSWKMVHPSRNVTCICHLWNSKSVCITLICAPDSPASTTKNIVPQCLAHQQIQTTHFHATPTKSFRGSSPCDRGSTSRKIVKKSTPRKLLFWTCSRGSKNAGRGSFAEGPAEGWPYVQLKYEGIKTKTHVCIMNIFCFHVVTTVTTPLAGSWVTVMVSVFASSRRSNVYSVRSKHR